MNLTKNKALIAGGLTALVAGTAMLMPETAHAADQIAQAADTVSKYGFFSGIIDGALLPFNAVVSLYNGDIVRGASWAMDGFGISSEPNNFGYWIGYFIAAGTDTIFGALASSASSD